MKSRLLGAVCVGLAAVSFNVNAATIVDNGTYTTVDGVDWLDLTETAGMSYNAVSAQLGPGGALEGWAYASIAQVEDLWTAFGGNQAYYNGWSTQNNGLFAAIAPLMGDTGCEFFGNCTPGDWYTYWLTSDVYFSGGAHQIAATGWDSTDSRKELMDWIDSSFDGQNDTISRIVVGSALVRSTSAVPIPAAVWLFGTGLLGLFGVARRKVRV